MAFVKLENKTSEQELLSSQVFTKKLAPNLNRTTSLKFLVVSMLKTKMAILAPRLRSLLTQLKLSQMAYLKITKKLGRNYPYQKTLPNLPVAAAPVPVMSAEVIVEIAAEAPTLQQLPKNHHGASSRHRMIRAKRNFMCSLKTLMMLRVCQRSVIFVSLIQVSKRLS